MSPTACAARGAGRAAATHDPPGLGDGREQRGRHRQPTTERRPGPQGGALFHTDAVQAAGKLPLNVARSPVDLLSTVGPQAARAQGDGRALRAVRRRARADRLRRRPGAWPALGDRERGRHRRLRSGGACSRAPRWARSRRDLSACANAAGRGHHGEIENAYLIGDPYQRLPATCALASRARRPRPSGCCSSSTTPASPSRRAAPAARTMPASLVRAHGDGLRPDSRARLAAHQLGCCTSDDDIDRLLDVASQGGGVAGNRSRPMPASACGRERSSRD